MLYFRWSRKALLIVLICIAIFCFKIWRKVFDSSNSIATAFPQQGNSKNFELKTLVHWAPKFNQLYSCPLCFGYQMCNEINQGSLLFHGELTIAHNNRIMWKKGVLHADRILISSLILDEWNKFDEFICRNASQTIPCDLSTAVWKTALVKDDLFTIEYFQNLNALFDIPHTQLALPICSSKKLLKEIQKTFDDDFNGNLNDEEKLFLLTSLIMQPGYIILKLQLRKRMTMPFPNLLGACGRSIILEGGLTPLKAFLSESFDTRAGLALQVLQIVEDFEVEDPHWYFLYTGFSLDSIVVTKEGEVVILDLDDLVVIDKSEFLQGSRKAFSSPGLCNEVCFQKITLEMFYSSNYTSKCSYITEYGQLMYAIVCKQVFSNLEEHRTEGFFNFDGHRIHKKLKYPGLLHSIPFKTRDHMEDLLRECVQETKPRGRTKAVAQLRDILENFVNINDFKGHNSITFPIPFRSTSLTKLQVVL